MTCANAFAQTLRRYTSLNHLAQAARAVLQNTAQITQMLSDLNRVDFANVQVCLSMSVCVRVRDTPQAIPFITALYIPLKSVLKYYTIILCDVM